MFNLGFTEILFILVVALLIFGADKLPEIAKSLGKALREFKKSINNISDQSEDDSK